MAARWLGRSWLFEIVDKESNNVDESFTLIFPPQSVEIREAQRVNITKTFGNAIIDDYGPDNLEITISAISGTTHAFPTFTTTGNPAPFDRGRVGRIQQQAEETQLGGGYDAESAFYTFRNKIMRYKENIDTPYSSKEMRVYDLGDQQAYRCILLEFQLSRNADQPLWYPFTISLFVYDKLNSKDYKKEKVKEQKIKTSVDQKQKLKESQSLLDKAKDLYAGVNNVLGKINAVSQQVDLAFTRVASAAQQVSGLAQGVANVAATPLDLSKRLSDLTVSAIASARSAYESGRTTFNQYMNAKEILNEQWRGVIGVFNTEVAKGSQNAKTVGKPLDVGVSADGNQQTDIETYNYSGLKSYSVKANDSLQSIAQMELGDEDLWYYIAQVNDFPGNGSISPGQEIYVPVQVDPNSSLKDAFIITENPLRNPYGTDISISADGDLLINDNGTDFQTRSGVENVKQSVDIKFTTPIGSMLKQTAFGISAGIGRAGDDLAISYLQMSMTSTLLLDPRITDVSNLSISIDGEQISATMNIEIVGREESLPVSVNI